MTEFIGRADLVATLWERLRTWHMVLLGPRRVGKSRMLEEMQKNPIHGCTLLRIDLQGANTIQALVERLRDELLSASRIRDVSKRVESVEVFGVGLELGAAKTRSPWSEIRELLLPKASQESLFVVALDEVPWWLDAVEREKSGTARTVLAELRRLRDDRRLANVRWILTGSVGIASRAAKWQASAELNDPDIFEVPPLDQAGGTTLFEMECTGQGRRCAQSAGARAHFLAGGRPHWIQLLAQRSATGISPESIVTAEVVDREVQRLLGTQYRYLFQDEGEGHFGREYLENEARIASRILDILAPASEALPTMGVIATAMEGFEKADILRTIRRLVEDFYLTETDSDHLQMSVPLFARWWQKWGGS